MDVKQLNEKYKKILIGFIIFIVLILGFKIYFSASPPPEKLTFQQRIQSMIDDQTGKTEMINKQKKDLNDRIKEKQKVNTGLYILKTFLIAMSLSIIPIIIYLQTNKKKEKNNRKKAKELNQSVDQFANLKSKKQTINKIENKETINDIKKQDIPIKISEESNKNIEKDNNLELNTEEKLLDKGDESKEVSDNKDTESNVIEINTDETNSTNTNKEKDSLPDIPDI